VITLRPAILVAAFYGVIVVALLASHAWDPRFFATVGPQWQRHDPGLRKQADGSIYYEFASDPVEAATRHDRFRTARILYPAVAHALALGRASLVGWTLLFVNVLSIVLGTAILQRLLERRGLPGWAALAYGLWGGLGVALLHGTAEPVAYLCVLAGLAAQDRRRPMLAGTAYLGGLLGRETTGALAAPYLLLGHGARPAIALGVAVAWGLWLALVALAGIGPLLQPGLGPRFPLVSYRATRWLDLPPTLLFLVVPALLVLGWAVGALRVRPADASVWAAGMNALLVLWLPPSTTELFWHSGRLSTGLVAATLVCVPLATTAPRLWRTLTLVFATSALWTLAITARYLFWE
jgi:hypothetical protein